MNQATVVSLEKYANAKIVLDTIKYMKANPVARKRDAAPIKNVVSKEIVVSEGKFVSVKTALPTNIYKTVVINSNPVASAKDVAPRKNVVKKEIAAKQDKYVNVKIVRLLKLHLAVVTLIVAVLSNSVAKQVIVANQEKYVNAKIVLLSNNILAFAGMRLVLNLTDAVKIKNVVNPAIVVLKDQFVSAKIALLLKTNNLAVAFIVKDVI